METELKKKVSKGEEKVPFQRLTALLLVFYRSGEEYSLRLCGVEALVTHHFWQSPMYKPGFMDPLA